MNDKIGGQRPRPRVALLGTFGADDTAYFLSMFPTIWRADDIDDLKKQVNVREVDLLVIARGVEGASGWPSETHVICFSEDIDSLPGPLPGTSIRILGAAETEEFSFPEVPLPISRRRKADYGNLTSVRGLPRLCLSYDKAVGDAEREVAKNFFDSGAIICERWNNCPLAVYLLRQDYPRGVAWLPTEYENEAAWVDLLVTEWAQSDESAFPSRGDWTNSSEWMVPQEMQILSQIQALEQKKQQFIVEVDQQIGELSTKLGLAKADANEGQRRLITAQDEELVDEVAKTLKNIGFDVTRVDQLLSEKKPKREDLRLKHSDQGGEEWNAIAEVRGYTRSGGTTADLQRLARFAELYSKETGQTPDKRIYIVNGQLELLPPSQRQEPLASAAEDLQIFSESDGILIWSIDQFRALKTTKTAEYPALIESIKCAQGRWVPVGFSSPKET